MAVENLHPYPVRFYLDCSRSVNVISHRLRILNSSSYLYLLNLT